MTTPRHEPKSKNLPIRAALAFSQLYRLAYVQVAPDLTILQASSNFQSILLDKEVGAEGRHLTEVLVEFVGNETVLELVLNGAMPSFQLELVRRDQEDGSTRFLTFHVLPLDEFQAGKGLLCLVEDASRLGQIGQRLIQKRNDVKLIQEALARAYAELERLATSNRKTAEAALQMANLELQEAYDRTMEGWVRALDLRDRETEGHTLRVVEVTLRLARAMGVQEPEITHIRRGALLHDIGKMGVPDSILLKGENLSETEWVVMKKHPSYAFEMLSPISYLYPALDIPYCHHEKWDGSGYPRGLQGEQIPLAARIFAVVDVWDALRSNRPYRLGWPDEKVIEHIRANAGTHFDPRIVNAFMRVLTEMAQEQELELD
jgi:putative nucleotidyltransferase with HDIG domain